MGSELLESIGLGNVDIAYFIIALMVCMVLLITLVVILMVQNNKLKKKYDRFMQGKKAASLEDQIMRLCAEHDVFKEQADANSMAIKDLYRRQKGSFQKMALAKYDAFKEMGGKLSYCVALLDETNTGFIINSVHNTDGCYSYSKRIKNGVSEIELSTEEQKALEHAMVNGR